MRYRVVSDAASEFLVITGVGISDIKICKEAWVCPLIQNCTKFDVNPVNYTFKVRALSADKLSFIVAVNFKIGPRMDDYESLVKYAKLIASHDNVKELLQGVIKCEIRVSAASMTMIEILGMIKEVAPEIFGNVQLELNQFGLFIYNANLKRLTDGESFSENLVKWKVPRPGYRGQKIKKEVENQIKLMLQSRGCGQKTQKEAEDQPKSMLRRRGCGHKTQKEAENQLKLMVQRRGCMKQKIS